MKTLTVQMLPSVTEVIRSQWTRFRNNPVPYLILFAIFAIGLYFRLRRLGVAPLWIDETFTAWSARNFANGHGFSDPIGPTSPYRRAWLTTSLPITASFVVFGVSEWAARFPIVLYGMGSIGLAYLLGRRYNPLLGFLLAAFAAFDPFMVVWAREARMYAPFQFFFLASILVMASWYSEGNLRFKSPYPFALGVLVILGVHTQTAFLALGPAIVGFLTITIWTRLSERDGLTIDSLDRETRRMALLVIAGLLVAGAYIVLRGIPSVLFVTEPSTWPDRGPTYYWDLLGRDYAILSVLAILGIIYGWIRYEESRLLVLALVIPFVVASFTPRKAPRYLYHLLPLFGFFGLIGPADLLSKTWERVTVDDEEVTIGTFATAAVGPFMLIILLASPFAGYAVSSDVYDQPYHPGRSDWEKASEWVEERAGEDDLIASTRPELSMWYLGRTEYFFRQHGVQRAEHIDGQYVHTRTGAVYLNETADLRRLVEQDREVWLLAGKKFTGSFTDPEARAFVESNFEPVGDSSWRNIRVYHYHPESNESD